ncbi:MAG: ferredoxin--NADP reductase [Actinomycetota bacterium]|nr:ferredoxin--NADP reductase [Actinomycetota bacterium]
MATDSFLLPVSDVVKETADAHSIVFEVPEDARHAFQPKPGQFLTVAVPSDRDGLAARCYSLSSAPGDALTVTVKRTVDGYASNWICDNLRPGDTLRVLPPSGIFTPADIDADFLLFAGGSGVTPIISIARTALREGTGRIVVFYANRDERSVIFAEEWARLSAEHPDRLQVVHWLESVQGLPTGEQLKAFAADRRTYDAFVCGPAPFMKATIAALKELEFPRARRHQEKFASLGGNPFGEVAPVKEAEAEVVDDGPKQPATLEIELDGTTTTYDDWDPGTPMLEFLEAKGIKAPYSCREGECSACAFRLLEGDVKMVRNDVLEQEDLDDGIRLGCQSLPTTDTVRGTYS